MTGGNPIDEAEVDGDGDDFEAAAAGLHDDLALHVESVGAQSHVAQQIRRVKPEAALRVGDARPGGF